MIKNIPMMDGGISTAFMHFHQNVLVHHNIRFVMHPGQNGIAFRPRITITPTHGHLNLTFGHIVHNNLTRLRILLLMQITLLDTGFQVLNIAQTTDGHIFSRFGHIHRNKVTFVFMNYS